MSTLVLKSLNHLYKLFKVYLGLAVLGGLAVIAVGFIITKPLVVVISFMTFSFLLMGIFLLAQARRLNIGRYQEYNPDREYATTKEVSKEYEGGASNSSETYSELVNTGKKVNEGQRGINGALCYVDWHVIYSMYALTKALEDAGVLTKAQLSNAKKRLEQARYTSERVPDIDPPGCSVEFEIKDESTSDTRNELAS